jgi:iron-sulfur cluster assembly protein
MTAKIPAESITMESTNDRDTKGAGTTMITLTPVAAEKVKDLLTTRGNPQAGLRVGVRGGGCSGNSYFMEFCDAESPGDQVVESNGVRLVVDSRSAALLGGTEVDFVEGLMGTGFKFNNPNVRHNCACGESFSV